MKILQQGDDSSRLLSEAVNTKIEPGERKSHGYLRSHETNVAAIWLCSLLIDDAVKIHRVSDDAHERYPIDQCSKHEDMEHLCL